MFHVSSKWHEWSNHRNFARINNCTDHEEADNFFLLHANHAFTAFPSIIIKTPDTHIVFFNRCFVQQHELSADLYVAISNSRSSCLISVRSVAKKYGTGGVSSWCNGQSDGLRNRSTRIRTPVALLRSLSGKYPWERYEPPYPPSYGLNSTTTVLLGE